MSTSVEQQASRERTYDKTELYIDGAWVPSSSGESLEVIDSTTEQVMGHIPAGTPEDVDRAVQAARRAFPAWSALPVAERADYLQAISDGLKARGQELAELVAREVGMPVKTGIMAQAALPAMDFATLAAAVREFSFEERIGDTLVVREPIGVVGGIAPWNYPLHQIAAKVAPALAAGCTIVIKPSEIAPLNAYVLAEVIDQIGLPAGVFNLITGVGPVVGEALAAHPEVDMVSFTGSTRAGKRVSELAAQTVKRVTLELGGKSPNIILDDADLEQAIPDGVAKCYANSGQTCTAFTRMLVPRAQLPEVERIAKQAAEAFAVGDPFAEDTRLGPLISATQQERVRDYIAKGIDEGAKLLTGGAAQPAEHDTGYFVSPTVFSEVSNDMTIAREEIFGPVLSIIPYDSEEEAIQIANDTPYGLAGGVWSSDPQRAEAVARKVRSGGVDINGGAFNLNAPFGGYKQSGNGREFGKYGLEEYLEVKSLHGAK